MSDKEKVFDILDKMDKEIILSERISDPERRKEFIKHTKKIIDEDVSEKWFVEFSSDYSKIRKITKNK